MTKRLLIKFTSTIIGILLFSQIAIAAHSSNKYYLKTGIGINHIHPTKFSNHDFEGKIILTNSFPLIELGIGYEFNESIRTELLFDYYFLFRTHETSFNPSKDTFKIAVTTKADSLMFNLYKDVLNIGKVSPFIGGGIGIATLKEVGTGYVVSLEDNIHYPLQSSKKKTFYKFAYKLTGGVDVKVSDITNVEISYNYYNLGNNKSKIIGGIANIGNRNYGVHNVTLALRFKL